MSKNKSPNPVQWMKICEMINRLGPCACYDKSCKICVEKARILAE